MLGATQWSGFEREDGRFEIRCLRKSPWGYDAIYRMMVDRANLEYGPDRRAIVRDILEVQQRMDALPRLLGIVRGTGPNFPWKTIQ